MNRGFLSFLAVAWAVAAGGFGQSRTPHDLDPMKQALVEPIMALEYGEEIGLTQAQRSQIEEELRAARVKFRPLDERLRAETRAMFDLLAKPGVTESEALAQLDRILELEKQIKQANLLCSLHVRALLRPDQRDKLRYLPLPPPPPPPPPPPAAPPPADHGGFPE